MACVRSSFFAGEEFTDLADAQGRAERWWRHYRRPAHPRHLPGPTGRCFALEERPLLLPAPTEATTCPPTPPKVARDHHIEVAGPSTRCPANLIGQLVDVRADRTVVRVFHRGQLVKVPVRVPVGGRRTDPDDVPSDKTTYALETSTTSGAWSPATVPPSVAATALLDVPLPWTRMRQVYSLLDLAKKWGSERVDAACARALEAEAVSVSLIGRMLERAPRTGLPFNPHVPAGRLARDPGHNHRRCGVSARHRPSRPSSSPCCGGSSSAAASTPCPSVGDGPRRVPGSACRCERRSPAGSVDRRLLRAMSVLAGLGEVRDAGATGTRQQSVDDACVRPWSAIHGSYGGTLGH